MPEVQPTTIAVATTAIEPINLAQDFFMSNNLASLEQSLVAAARNTAVEQFRQQGVTLTNTEMEAVVTVQVLKEINTVDLATVLLRYKYLRKIQNEGVLSRHPAQYGSLTLMAQQNGISIAEISRTIDLVEIVFPYLSETLHMDVAAAWKEVGKSNFHDMLPILKILITGEERNTQAAQTAARFLDDAAASYQAQGLPVPSDEELRMGVVSDIIERGTLLNNHELRTHLRPERTPSIETHYFISDNTGYVLMPVTEDQMNMLARRAGACIDVVRHESVDINTRTDPSVRGFLQTLGVR